ncbi:hypothetical protein [uncultured Amnibacterium sp.]|uniref:hypothetical protein n=1 Tax=uncultured Amnibacterium sp. TaxID=1631851 RepID=UPI0035CA70FC
MPPEVSPDELPTTASRQHGNYKKIYVMYPRGDQTGGPEALHQLVHTLREMGQQAYLFPRPGTAQNARAAAYEKYNAPEVAWPSDDTGNAIIASEMSIHLLRRFVSADRFCWWLSIDNSPLVKDERSRYNVWAADGTRAQRPLVGQVRALVRQVKRRLRGDYRLLRDVEHLAQSEYALSYLYSKFDITATLLTDYTTLPNFADRIVAPASARGDIVAYNPKKAARVTAVVMKYMPDVVFRPLEKMTRDEVVETLLTSAIYLDLGYHPGKDRMPREAVLCGAVTIVGRRGTGAFDGDTPLPWEQKVATSGSYVENAVKVVRATLNNLDSAVLGQASYKVIVEAERDTFRKDVKRCFIDGHLSSRS